MSKKDIKNNISLQNLSQLSLLTAFLYWLYRLTVASIPFKNNGLAFLIAIIAGVFGFCGIGHIYIGKVLRGVLIMFIGWIPFVIGIFVFLAEFISQNDPIIQGLDLSMIFGIAYVVFWIIQALDANRLAKKYNKYLMINNKPLW